MVCKLAKSALSINRSTSKRASSSVWPRKSISVFKWLLPPERDTTDACFFGFSACCSNCKSESFALIFIIPACSCTVPEASGGDSTVAVWSSEIRRTISPAFKFLGGLLVRDGAALAFPASFSCSRRKALRAASACCNASFNAALSRMERNSFIMRCDSSLALSKIRMASVRASSTILTRCRSSVSRSFVSSLRRFFASRLAVSACLRCCAAF